MKIRQINHLTLFKFTDELGDRLQTLIGKKKSDTLTSTENLELEAIAELDEIFGCVNGAIAIKPLKMGSALKGMIRRTKLWFNCVTASGGNRKTQKALLCKWMSYIWLFEELIGI